MKEAIEGIRLPAAALARNAATHTGSDTIAMTSRTRLKRLPKRASYDRDVINALLDTALVCHVGFAIDGQPYVIPTLQVRIGDRLYIHGSAASRMLGTAVFIRVLRISPLRPLSLELHHINGVGQDKRLENLALLCPNCHSQTDTWGGRNRDRAPPATGEA